MMIQPEQTCRSYHTAFIGDDMMDQEGDECTSARGGER